MLEAALRRGLLMSVYRFRVHIGCIYGKIRESREISREYKI